MGIVQDLRYALRALAKNLGYAVVASLTLALGIGANTAIFSVVNAVVLQPLEYRAPGQLVMVHTQFPSMGFDEFWISAPEYRELREWSQSFEDMAIYRIGQSSIRGSDEPMRVNSASATAELFSVLGVDAMEGRVFSKEEDQPGSGDVVVLTHELWRRAFGSDASVIGRRVEVDGEPLTVIGIMPPRFDIDDNLVELWRPLALDPNNYPSRGGHNYKLVARLGSRIGIDEARAEVDALVVRWREEAGGSHAPSPEGHPLVLEGLHEEVVGEARPALLMLLVVVGLVLLVACANVANLLLAKAESRQKEIAVRSAMGASRFALLRQFLVESVVLALAGGVLGVLFALVGIRALLASYPSSIPRASEIGVDGTVLAFSLLASVVTGLIFGLAPLLHLSPRGMGMALKEGGQRSTAASARQRVRQGLVVLEVAAAVMLVVCCGLVLRSLWMMQSVDPGFRSGGLSTFQLYLPETSYPNPGSQITFFVDLFERLQNIPGVEHAAGMSGLPPRRRINANDMEFESLAPSEDGPPHNIDYWNFVAGDYFETMGIPIVDGRGFRPSDDGGATPVTVINETMAQVFWPGQNPIGQRLRPPSDQVPWITIVGIAKDVKQGGLEEETGTECYFYYPQTGALGFAPRSMNVVMRSTLPPSVVAESARESVWARDPSLPLANLREMDEVLSDSLSRPRFVTLLLVVFALVALSLAAIGTYGVLSYAVAERTSEIGIRMALGAGTGGVLKLVLVQGLTLALLGAGLGLALAFALSRFLSTLLYGVSTTDPVTFVTVPVVLLGVALVACLIPAYRAMRIEPVVALRYE